jgi:hypothetical protein
MLKPKDAKISCIHCRIKCHEYKIANNEIQLNRYENLAIECKFYTEVLPL